MNIKTPLIGIALALMAWANPISSDPLLTEPFDAIRMLVDTDPKAAISELEGINHSSLKKEQVATYYLLKSQALFSLAHPNQALTEANNGLQYIGNERSKYSRRLDIARALALLIAGNSEDAISILDSVEYESIRENDQENLLTALASRGTAHLYSGNQTLASFDFNKAYNMAPDRLEQKNPLLLTKDRFYRSLAKIAINERDYRKAIDLLDKNIEINKQQSSLISLSIDYYEKGRAYIELNEFEQAEESLLLSMEASKKIGDDQGIGYANLKLAQIDRENGRFEQANSRLDAAYDIFQRGQVPGILIELFTEKALVYMAQSQYDKAVIAFDKISEFQALDQLTYQKITYLKLRSKLHEQMGDFKTAHQLLIEAEQLEEVYTKERLDKKINELRVAFEVADKKRLAELKSLEENNRSYRMQSILIIAIACFLLACVLLYFYIGKRRRRKVAQDSLQQE